MTWASRPRLDAGTALALRIEAALFVLQLLLLGVLVLVA